MRSLVLSLWWWCSVAAAVVGDVVYLRAQTNTSVQFSCLYPDFEGKIPFAFSLTHSSPDKVILYYFFKTEPNFEDNRWKSRISLQNDKKNRSMLVILEALQLDDSDLYRCLFHYDVPKTFDKLYAKNPITLFVESSRLSHGHVQASSRENTAFQPATSQTQSDVKTVCSDAHKPLLYALSCATGLLFISVLIIVVAYCNNPSGKNKSTHPFPTPVYEEMNGVRDKATLLVQDNDLLAAYAQPRKENPYFN